MHNNEYRKIKQHQNLILGGKKGREKKLEKQEQHCLDMSLISMVTSYQAGRVWHVVSPMITPLPPTHTLPKLLQDEFA